MGGKVVVNKELAAHEEEREVVGCPADEEQTGVVPEAVADGCHQ